MNLDQIGEEIRSRQAMMVASEFCGQCMRESPVGGVFFHKLNPELLINEELVKSLAILICKDCTLDCKPEVIQKSVLYMLQELNVSFLQ